MAFSNRIDTFDRELLYGYYSNYDAPYRRSHYASLTKLQDTSSPPDLSINYEGCYICDRPHDDRLSG